MSLDAGALDTPVYISQTAELDDGFGGAQIGPGTELEVWASVMPANSRQLWKAAQRQQTLDVVVMIRWRPDLAAMKSGHLRYTDRAGVERKLSVQTCFDPDNLADTLELHCVEATGGPT